MGLEFDRLQAHGLTRKRPRALDRGGIESVLISVTGLEASACGVRNEKQGTDKELARWGKSPDIDTEEQSRYSL